MSSTQTLSLLIVAFLVGCQTPQHRRDVAQTSQPEDYLKPQSFDMLSKYTPHKYEVLFTDPLCGVYKYNTQVLSRSGKALTQKPENVYCKNQYDQKRSGDQPNSPQHRLVDWISDPSVKEIYFTYFSFSNRAVKNALCDAAANRNVKIKFVLDSSQDQTRADELIACNPNNVQKKTRGQEGGIGYAHNKFFIINPNTPGEFKVVFSSGNMTSGPVIHHENWNFITTNSQSQFAQAHLCAMKAEWGEDSGHSRVSYINSIRNCRAQIATPVEKDVKVFFVPGEGEREGKSDDKYYVQPQYRKPDSRPKTASDYMIEGDGKFPGIETASKIWLGCHRFFYNKMIGALKYRMYSKNKPDMRIVADDDTYYTGNPDPDGDFSSDVMPAEYENIQSLVTRGAKAKYMETNADEHQLHHSKYLIFADKSGKFTSVYTGSANLTGAGFRTNWENSYYITVPEVVQQFADHYQKMWNTMATSPEDMPVKANMAPYLDDKPIINNP